MDTRLLMSYDACHRRHALAVSTRRVRNVIDDLGDGAIEPLRTHQFMKSHTVQLERGPTVLTCYTSYAAPVRRDDSMGKKIVPFLVLERLEVQTASHASERAVSARTFVCSTTMTRAAGTRAFVRVERLSREKSVGIAVWAGPCGPFHRNLRGVPRIATS